MKQIAILCLLLVSVLAAGEKKEVQVKQSSNDIIEIITCFLGKQELITDIKDIIEVIKTGDYSKLITIALKVYSDVSNAIKDCIPQKVSSTVNNYMCEKCIKDCQRGIWTNPKCLEECYKKYCKW